MTKAEFLKKYYCIFCQDTNNPNQYLTVVIERSTKNVKYTTPPSEIDTQLINNTSATEEHLVDLIKRAQLDSVVLNFSIKNYLPNNNNSVNDISEMYE
ncbi:MAG: hypothetical protein H6Q15_1914 [Bacteroidetes bacterium]|nr:hypothetical protein [Bacteroidota bacterium]